VMSGDRVTSGEIATDVPHPLSAPAESLASDGTVLRLARIARRDRVALRGADPNSGSAHS